MPDVKRTVKIVTEQRVIDKDSKDEHPNRKWNINIYLKGPDGEDLQANVFEKVVYKLHPTFDRPTQIVKQAPFRIDREGWGEFDMQIFLTEADKGATHTVDHDLNFRSERYEHERTVTFKNPKPGLLALLKESGPIPGEANGVKGRDESAKKKKRPDKGIDMEKLAENLQKLGEDDLLYVVQMIHDNKTAESWIKNDVENGEFHVDLFTLPDSLLRQLWDFTIEKLGR